MFFFYVFYLFVYTGPDYILEREDEPGVSLDLDAKLCDVGTMCFLMVREHSKYGVKATITTTTKIVT